MIVLKVLSGKKAGCSQAFRHFPVRIGRSAKSDVILEENGVWEDHLGIDWDKARGFVAKSSPNALTTINGETVREFFLKNGDVMELGSARVQFWLAPVPQKRLAIAEAFAWVSIAAVTLGEALAVYLLVRQQQ